MQLLHHRVAAAAAGDAASSSSSSSSSKWVRPPEAPWSLTFDLRERDTEWSDANKCRLVALVAAQQLAIPMADMEQRLEALMLLLPDLAGTIFKLQPGLLAGLTSDLAVTSSRLLALRELLPAANVSRVVAERPQLLLQDSSEVQQAVEVLQQLLHVERVDKLVEAQPLLLVTPCVEEVLADIRRLLPGRDAEQLLAADPDWVLRVQRGQRWLGQHPDSDPGELISWTPPVPEAAAKNQEVPLIAGSEAIGARVAGQ
ncbi:hypothetical protein OEZ85_006188 [Tetradesmus obliquus]|uniref:Uncharacterized protein n=1 Tax=Tetradesmus obliquus TaxID=3088 RepID=A0ABY8UJ70_TETOB|nr:hypothetical protein OEZ85_006188 [Tetradesmus obliquus]